VLIQVPRFSKFLHGMALLHPGRCSESPRWFVWDEAAGCAVPAGLAGMRGISEERITMKQQVGRVLACTDFCFGQCLQSVAGSFPAIVNAVLFELRTVMLGSITNIIFPSPDCHTCHSSCSQVSDHAAAFRKLMHGQLHRQQLAGPASAAQAHPLPSPCLEKPPL
jgi:hypothetical protein